MKRKNRMRMYHVWRVIYPMALYSLLQGLIYGIGMLAVLLFFPETAGKIEGSLEASADLSVSLLLVSTIVSAVLFGLLYRGDVLERKQQGKERRTRPLTKGQVFWIVCGSMGFAAAGNNLINLTPLPEWSQSYEETNAMLMSGSLILQILCVGLLAPIVEEILMRGILYGRLRDQLQPFWAIFWGGICFGIFHGNLVQGVYAACMGWFLCWLMEEFGTLWAACISHMTANLTVTLFMNGAAYERVLASPVLFAAVTVISVAAVFLSIRRIRS